MELACSLIETDRLMRSLSKKKPAFSKACCHTEMYHIIRFVEVICQNSGAMPHLLESKAVALVVDLSKYYFNHVHIFRFYARFQSIYLYLLHHVKTLTNKSQTTI